MTKDVRGAILHARGIKIMGYVCYIHRPKQLMGQGDVTLLRSFSKITDSKAWDVERIG